MAGRKLKINKSNYAVGYVRRSTDRQEQSIPDQKRAIGSYCAEYGLKLLRFYVDDAIRGTDTFARGAFQQMIKDSRKSGKCFGKIIVYDVKRFGRIDNDEAGYYRYILRTNGVEILYISENFNGDTTDDLLRPVKQWQARQESKDLSKITIRGLLSKSGTGSWMGGVPPYGYDLRYENQQGQFLLILRYMPDGTKQILDGDKKLIRTLSKSETLTISKCDYAKLTPGDPSKIKILREIFRMYIELGKGYKSIAYTLNNNNIPSPRNSQWSYIYRGKWTGTTIRSILVNPIYSGDMVWNRRTDARFHRISKGLAVDRKDIHGARLVPNDKTDWIIVRDAHPALISRRIFEAVKQQMEYRGQKGLNSTHGRTWNGKRSRFILSSLLKCDICGSRYQGITRSKGKKRQDGTRVKNHYYACGGYITKGKKICNMNSIQQQELEQKVINVVLNYYKTYLKEDGSIKLAKIIKQQSGLEKEDLVNARKRIEQELNRTSKIIDNLLDNITKANRQYVDKRLNELGNKRQQLEYRLQELEMLWLSQAEIKSIITDSVQFISTLEFILDKGLAHEKLIALRRCIKKILINKPAGEIRLYIFKVPSGNIKAIRKFKVPI